MRIFSPKDPFKKRWFGEKYAFVRDQTRVPKGDPPVGLSDHLTCSHGVSNPGPWKLNFILVQCVLAKWSSLLTLKYFTFNIYGKFPKHKLFLWRELLWHFNHDIYVLYSKIWHHFFKTKLSYLAVEAVTWVIQLCVKIMTMYFRYSNRPIKVDLLQFWFRRCLVVFIFVVWV